MTNQQNLPKTFKFKLPLGLLDHQGMTHNQGTMRRTNGIDQLILYSDPQSQDNPGYGILIVLARSIIELGNLNQITPRMLEQLFLPDLHYLLEFYNSIAPKELQLSLSGEL